VAGIALRASRLTKRFGALVAVDALSLEVREGEVFGLLGPNGAGKTTAINLICGLLRPDAGEVNIRGEPVRGGNPEVRRQVGMCPQEPILWERLTCLEQLQFVGQMYGLPGSQARRRGERLLEELNLGERRRQQARRLSGGMRRRLNLALALVHDPQVLVLDEPDAGLDPQSRVRVREVVRALAGEKTVLFTTHNMDEAERLGDRVAIIDQGKLLVVDAPERLKAQVGEGDVLEIDIDRTPGQEAWLAGLRSALPPTGRLSREGHRLTLRAPEAVRLLPTVLEHLEAQGLRAQAVRLRQNTLEDVFIHLTGRRLRE
jgi:ABC-2 type transport system ATP-binding protein